MGVHEKYKIEGLLLFCNQGNMVLNSEDKDWLNMPLVGGEIFDEWIVTIWR